MKVGIFFGGQSREREISFAGGRTVYDNLNKELFEPVPIFVDSLGNFILVNWEFIYKGTIRDFYPPLSLLSERKSSYQIYAESLGELSQEEVEELINSVGRKVYPEEFNKLFDFAFLALHGPYGEDGNIQGLLEWYNIPYSGSGILPSAIGINKVVQKDIMISNGFESPSKQILERSAWLQSKDKKAILSSLVENLGLPLVIKAPNQGSSIGVSILSEADVNKFISEVNRSFFIKEIEASEWKKLKEEERHSFMVSLIDIREGIGMPVYTKNNLIYHPDDLVQYIDDQVNQGTESISLTSVNSEEYILFESFIDGKEFSCIVVQDEQGNPVALPPTEIRKGKEIFDYRSKYLPGMTRKITPIHIADELIEKIRSECSRLFSVLHCNVYARIDGFITEDNRIFLNDPNTTSGMLPSSFFFHQAAEIGLNPSQFLTYIIRTSLAERIKNGKKNQEFKNLVFKLDHDIHKVAQAISQKIKVGVIMGGFSSERHISVESGRNIYEKLSSSTKYTPVPIFLTGNEDRHELYIMPVNIMLKDNADDIKEKISTYNKEKQHPVIQKIVRETKAITSNYAQQAILEFREINYTQLKEVVDTIFIALHGRPGEDGAVQTELEKYNIPYNGSGISSSQLTINKYETNELLAQHGIKVARHRLVYKEEWISSFESLVVEIEKEFPYPFIAKPADDGCSSAVKKIKKRDELVSFARLIFRPEEELIAAEAQVLKLKRNEEFPQKNHFLIEELITRGSAKHFLEITGGLLTKNGESGVLEYEIFEPSEALAFEEVLSLEEKFLAGEGQNITPARFMPGQEGNKNVSEVVKKELEKVARILNVEGYARIDAFVKIYDNMEVETIIIEVNSLPGMTPATCIFHQSAINGYKPYNFIDAIISYGMGRNNKKLNQIL
ncbi:hypothetical protein BH23BAC1_BH23BAC1_18950 [soil metagenome]